MKRTAKSGRELGQLLGVTHQAVRKWIQNPEWPFGAKPPWDVGAVQKWTKSVLRERTDEKASADDSELETTIGYQLKRAKLNLEVERMCKLKMERLILEGQYVKRADVERNMVSRIHHAKAVLLGMARTLAPQLVGLDSKSVEVLIDAGVRKALETLAVDAGGTDGVDAAGAADAEPVGDEVPAVTEGAEQESRAVAERASAVPRGDHGPVRSGRRRRGNGDEGRPGGGQRGGA